jgi:DNA polymerase I-like protein with 3'-5' exonuclease and polymerase domains
MVQRIDDARQDELGLPEVVRIFNAPAGWAPPTVFPELSGMVAIDLETKDPGIARGTGPSWALRGEGFVCGVALRWYEGIAYYPLRHAAGNMMLPEALFFAWLRMQALKPDVTFVMANASYDTGWLKRVGVIPHNPPVDVQVMAFLLDEHRKSYSLSNLARDYLGRDKSTQSLVDMARTWHITNPMANMDRLPAWIVALYAHDDVDLTYQLYEVLLPKIAEQELGNVLRLESDSAMAAVDMRWTGVRVDQDRLERLGKEFALRRDYALNIIADITEIRMQPFENDSAMKALRAENPNVRFGTTERGRDSVDRFTLQTIGSPVAKAILNARRYEKARNTFVESLGNYIHNGRIHAEFHSTRNNSSNDDDVFGNDSMFGAGSGRFASSHPNLQNIPIRDPEIGPAIRACFIPEEGERWVKLDYASQEPRLTVHFASLATRNGQKLRGAAEMVARFQRDPLTDLHEECGTLMGIPRKQAKTINLALAYGMQGASLCRSLGLPTKMERMRDGRLIEVAGDEGQRLLDRHAHAVPFIRELFDIAKRVAKERGYVKTISGRRIHFEKYDDGNYMRLHKALNGVIQGSAADQMKMALVALRAEGLPASLTVHDEADRSVPLGESGEIMIDRMTTIMEDVLHLAVPVVAEAKTGDSWGTCS